MTRRPSIPPATPAIAAAAACLLIGCGQAPPASHFASTAGDKAAETRLRPSDSMPPLQPFDEQFVVVDRGDETP